MKKKQKNNSFETLDLFSQEYMDSIKDTNEGNIEIKQQETVCLQEQDLKEQAISHKEKVPKKHWIFDNNLRERSERKILKITLQSGDVICYNRAIDTYIAFLQTLSNAQLCDIKLNVAHLPLIDTINHPNYIEWISKEETKMYLNKQSNTEQKWLQLQVINKQLEIGAKIEIGNFDTSKNEQRKHCRTKRIDFDVILNGEKIKGNNGTETYIKAIAAIGIDAIQRKDITFNHKKLITTHKDYNGQIQVAERQWITIPNGTKDKVKWLNIIAALMHKNLKANIIK